MLFADLLSLHLVTFLMLFILVHVTFLTADACLSSEVCHLLQSSKSPLTGFLCLSWSLQSIAEQQVSPHRLPMQYWLKNHWPDFKHSPHTNSISNSAILRNNYISLLSDLCACVHGKKKWRRKGSHSSSVSGSNRLVWLRTWKKAMGWCTAQWKMLLFCAKTIVKESRKCELPRLKKKKKEKKKKKKKKNKKKEKHSGSVLSRCFLAPLGMLFALKTLEDER